FSWPPSSPSKDGDSACSNRCCQRARRPQATVRENDVRRIVTTAGRQRRRAAGVALLSCFCIAFCLQRCAQVAREAKTDYVKVKSALASSDIEITLENSFVEKYMNRATIDVAYTVDKSNQRPHPAFLDGDVHFAGRAPQIGLPIVAEIKNAVQEPD